MKRNRGITLIALVVTVLVLMILASVSINVGTETYDMVKVENFIDELKVVQSKVDNIAEETDTFDSYGFTKLEDIKDTKTEDYDFFINLITNPSAYNIDTTNSWDETLDQDSANYYYFQNDDLEKIGLKNQNITVIINFKTRNVISRIGLEKDEKTYYRQYDLTQGNKLIK